MNQNVHGTKRERFATFAISTVDNFCLLQQYNWNTIKIHLPLFIINAPYDQIFMTILHLSVGEKNWQLSKGYFGSRGHALVAVAVVEWFERDNV